MTSQNQKNERCTFGTIGSIRNTTRTSLPPLPIAPSPSFKYVDIAIIYDISGHTWGKNSRIYSFYHRHPPSATSFFFSFAGELPLSSHILNCSGFSFHRVPDKLVYIIRISIRRNLFPNDACIRSPSCGSFGSKKFF